LFYVKSSFDEGKWETLFGGRLEVGTGKKKTR
jgi:hypothetical protein